MKYLKTLLRQYHDLYHRAGLSPFIKSILYILCSGIFPIVGLLLPRYIINQLTLGQSDLKSLFDFLFVMGGILLISGFGQSFFNRSAYCDFLDTRFKEFEKVSRLYLTIDYKYLENAKWLEKADRVTKTLSSDNIGYQATFVKVNEILGGIVSAFIYIYFIGKMSIEVLLVISLFTGISIYLNQKGKAYELQQKETKTVIERKEKYYRNVSQDFSYAKDIRLYDIHGYIMKCYHQQIENYKQLMNKIRHKQFDAYCLDQFLSILKDGFAYFVLIALVVNDKMMWGDFTLYLSAILALSTSLSLLTVKFGEVYEYLGYTNEYYQFLDQYTNNEKTQNKQPLDINSPFTIEFKNVSFKYPNSDRYIYHHFNLKINSGEKLAIVGINGAGKTTLIKLLLGLFTVDEGEILINGKNIQNYDLQEYQKLYAVVFQDIHFLSCSIAENISFKEKQYTFMDKVKAVLKQVGLDTKINSLKYGLNTTMLKVLDQEGIELSGGQGQNLAIARALYHDGQCVILDEPTAALDALAEQKIYENFNQLVKDKTTIFISHRLASTKFCDHIALFDADGLKEYGTHDELMKQRGIYYEMFMTQGKYYKEDQHEKNNTLSYAN